MTPRRWMHRRIGAAIAAAAAVAAGLGVAVAACGDPVVILGDAPGVMRIVGGIPDEPGATAASAATGSHLNTPRGLAMGADGIVWVADQRTSRILGIRPDGGLEVLVDHVDCTGSECLGRPDGIARAPDGTLVVADPGSDRVWRVDPSSGALEVIAGTGELGESPDGSVASESPVSTPTGIAVDAGGRVYFSERTGQRIRSITADGTLFTVAGDGIQGFSGDRGPAAAARLSSPAGLTVADGFLYLADSGNHRVRRIDLDGGEIVTVAGNGQRAYAGDGGPALDASLKLPHAVAVSPGGETLFIADLVDHRVRAMNLRSRRISTFAGTGAEVFEGDLLSAGETGLARPGGLAASPLGFLFISASGNHLVWRTPLEIR